MELHALASKAWRSLLNCGACVFSHGNQKTIADFTAGMSAITELVKRLEVFQPET